MTLDIASLRSERCARITHAVTLFGGFVFLLWLNRNQWFYYDDWDFLAERGLAGNGRSVWAPHNEHWVTIPVVVYQVIGRTVGLGHPLVFALPVLVSHVVVAHLLWRICLRAKVRVWTATALTTTFIFLGAGAENLLWSFQFCFVGSIAFGLAALLVADRPTPGGLQELVPAWALAVGALMCSGLGILLTGLTALILLCRRRVVRAFSFAAVPALAYAIWYLAYGHESRVRLVSGRNWVYLDDFVVRGLGYALGNWVGIAGAGSALILLVLYLGSSEVARGGHSLVPGLMCLVVFPMFLTIAITRIEIDINAGVAGRYAYLVVALVLPATAVAADRLCAPPRMLMTVAAFSLMSTWVGLTALVQYQRADAGTERPGRLAVSSAQILLGRGERILPERLDPVHPYGGPTVLALAALNERGRRVATGDISAAELLDSRFFLQSRIGPVVPGVPAMRLTSPVTGAPAPGCRSFANTQLEGRPSGGGTVRLIAAMPTDIEIRLTNPSGVVAHRTFTVPSGESYLTLTARDLGIAIVLGAAGLQVCTA